MTGPLIGGALGWYLRRRFNRSPSSPAGLQHQIDHVCKIDRHVSSVMAMLHEYEQRLLLETHLSENGSAATRSSLTDSDAENDLAQGLRRPGHRDLLDGKTLLEIKREVDQQIRTCTSVLTRSTAVLDEDVICRAQDLVDTLIAVREALEEQEADDETSPDAIRPHVAALHESRTCFLGTARTHLGIPSLSKDTTEQIEDLAEHTFSPAQCPRPYTTAGIRLPQERF